MEATASLCVILNIQFFALVKSMPTAQFALNGAVKEMTPQPLKANSSSVTFGDYPDKMGVTLVGFSFSHDISENGDSSIAEEAKKLAPYKLGLMITTYATPIIALSGLLGNTLSLLVMLRPHNRRISCCVYMAALAVTDDLVLLAATHHWFVPRFRSDGFHDVECKIVDFLLMGPSLLGVVFIVSMTMDRCIAVRFPFKAPRWCSARRAKIMVMVNTGLVAVYSAPYLLYSTADKSGQHCSTASSASHFMKIYSWTSVCLNSVIPFTILLILNVIIIHTVRNRKKFLQADEGQGRGSVSSGSSSVTSVMTSSSDDKARERQLTIMLVLVSLAVLILTMPQYVRYAVFSFVDYSTDAQLFANYILSVHITSKLFISNNAVNFFLYCLGGSKFRQDLSSLFRCSGKKSINSRSGENLSMSNNAPPSN